MLLLDSDEIEQVLTPQLCLDALEAVFGQLGHGQAVNMAGREVVLARLTDAEVPGARPGHAYHGLEVQSGTVPRMKTASLRVKSDVLYWPEVDGGFRRKKHPAAAGGLYCGFVILFDTDTGEPKALMPDGVVQRMRVGATSALGTKYLSRPESHVAGIIGAGWQAEAQVLTLDRVRDLREVRVFSPTPRNREELASRLDAVIDADVRPVGSAEEAVAGADIVHAATNSRTPVLRAEWLSPGTHVSVISMQEVGEELLASATTVAASRHHDPKLSYTVIADGFAEDVHEDEFQPGWWHNRAHWAKMPTLGELIDGRARGRTSADEVSLFINMGAAVQFAAVGAALMEAAARAGVGREIPTQWFLQPYAP